MSNSVSSSVSSAQALMFPAFIYGEKTPCRRKMKAEAKKWGKAYLAGREFPEPKLVPIAPGSVVYMDETGADMVRLGYNFIPNTNMVIVDGDAARQEGKHIQWRVYLIDDLRFEAKLPEMSREESSAFGRALNAFICKYPWGVISAAGSNSFLSDIDTILPRMEGALRYWETLDTLKYFGVHSHAMSLSEDMLSYFRGEIAMWVDRPTGNMRTDLETAMIQMRDASSDEIYERLVRRLRECVESMPGLENRDWLRLPGIIERGLKNERQRDQQWYENLTSGQCGKHQGFLVSLGRHYGPGGDLTLP